MKYFQIGKCWCAQAFSEISRLEEMMDDLTDPATWDELPPFSHIWTLYEEVDLLEHG